MIRTLRHGSKRYYVAVIRNDGKGAITAAASPEIVALVVWFLSCIPAQVLAVAGVKSLIWLKSWRDALSPGGWRDDLALMWLATRMMLRGEFA